MGSNGSVGGRAFDQVRQMGREFNFYVFGDWLRVFGRVLEWILGGGFRVFGQGFGVEAVELGANGFDEIEMILEGEAGCVAANVFAQAIFEHA